MLYLLCTYQNFQNQNYATKLKFSKYIDYLVGYYRTCQGPTTNLGSFDTNYIIFKNVESIKNFNFCPQNFLKKKLWMKIFESSRNTWIFYCKFLVPQLDWWPRSNCGNFYFIFWKMARNTSTLSTCYVYKKIS